MKYFYLLLPFLFWSCSADDSGSDTRPDEKAMEKQERLISTEELKKIVPDSSRLEFLAEGFIWSEGPLWHGGRLLFSDVPRNQINQWSEKDGLSVYLKPSGDVTNPEREGENGSNGLLLDAQQRLVLCQHGERQVARMKSSPDDPSPEFETLADSYQGKKLNSPNDAVFHSDGSLYFTDPPYGLSKEDGEFVDKQLDFQGVYRLSPEGELTLLTKELNRPNGLAFSPDESKMYVANSDPEHPVWMVYDIAEDGSFINGKIFFDASEYHEKYGFLPDGMKVDPKGNIFATGPGGFWIFSPEGKPLGMFRTEKPASNCAFDNDYKNIYITNADQIARLRLK